MSKLYTAFIFDDPAIHCTHKYLGKLDPANRAQVEKIISAVFDPLAVSLLLPKVRFTKEAWFGPQQDIRVLLPADNDAAVDALFPGLRAALDCYRPDTYPGYNPHVSTPSYTTIELPITGYAIMVGDCVKRRWPEGK